MMMWQDLVFMVGSGSSIFFLAPTLRDATARVPLGTSLPSMLIGLVYGLTFSTLGMTFSALGAFVTGTMWALIASFRSPGPGPVASAAAAARRLSNPRQASRRLRTDLSLLRRALDDQPLYGHVLPRADDRTHQHGHRNGGRHPVHGD